MLVLVEVVALVLVLLLEFKPISTLMDNLVGQGRFLSRLTPKGRLPELKPVSGKLGGQRAVPIETDS